MIRWRIEKENKIDIEKETDLILFKSTKYNEIKILWNNYVGIRLKKNQCILDKDVEDYFKLKKEVIIKRLKELENVFLEEKYVIN